MKLSQEKNGIAKLALLISLVMGVAMISVACPGAPNVQEKTTGQEWVKESNNADAGVTDTGAATDTGTQTDKSSCTPTEEVCDGKDNDCDGETDEGLNCPKDGDTKPCYTGPAGTQGKGECQEGTQTYTGGQWGKCEGETLPAKETCDGKDNNCDGKIDEALTQDCKNDCGAGKQRCQAGQWDECDAPKPEKEVCGDGKDNNCDGKTDEGCVCTAGQTQPCGAFDKGICKKGKQICDGAGSWGKCEGEVKPTAESCDGKDEDCDGSVDEGLTKPCYTGPAGTDGKGACKQGTQTCQAGQWSKCAGESLPGKEVCDGQDNDCNGSVDDLPELTCGNGPCANKVPACSGGKDNVCKPKAGQAETCNGKDDDCDGTVDNGATCPNGGTCTGGKCTGGTGPYRTGSFKSPGSYTVVGTVSVFKTSSGERIEFSTNFSTSSGPDLYIYLVKASGGAATNSPKNYISLGKIKNFKGAQSYTLNQASTGYKSIVVWCQRFGVNFGYADFTP